jgi:formate dehydrogenase subunit gamma
MAENLIKRFEPWERIIHGVHLVAFFILTLTGLGLYSQKLFGLTGLFGGVNASRVIHHYMGVVFIFTFLIISFAWMKDYMFNASDIEWAKVLGGYLNHKAKVPPQGMYNPGQKMLGWYVFLGGIVMSLTGLAMWFPFYLSPATQTWMYFLHDLAFIGFMLLMVVHAYLGTVGLPGTIRCMIDGYVTEGWAKHHHPLWYEKVKNRQ